MVGSRREVGGWSWWVDRSKMRCAMYEIFNNKNTQKKKLSETTPWMKATGNSHTSRLRSPWSHPGGFCPLIFYHISPSSDFGTSARLSVTSPRRAEKDQCRLVFVTGGATPSDLTHCGLCLEANTCRPLWGAGK